MDFFKVFDKNVGNKLKSRNKKKLSSDLKKNTQNIKECLGNSSDFSINTFKLDKKGSINLAIMFIKGVVDKNYLNTLYLQLNEIANIKNYKDANSPKDYFEIIEKNPFIGKAVTQIEDYEAIYDSILSGHTIIMIDGYSKCISIDIRETLGRSIEEPSSQTVIRGPKEGFTEKISVNIALIRKRIKNKYLRVESMSIGTTTKTDLALVYIEGLVQKEILDDLNQRLNSLKIDGILESSYIEELIKDNRYSIFPTFFNTERPDSIVAGLLEGKVAIIVDGTPFVITTPAFFNEFFQSSEDYYHHFIIASMIRFIRYISFVLTLYVPAVYIILTTFHQEMLPTPLLISIAAQREGVPFPAFVEAVLMEIMFEILREAGIRMPRVIGPAISIVGALVIGQAAVEAGIISAVMVIVVSITAIASFVLPNYTMSNAIRAIRFLFMIISSMFGFYGIFIASIILVLHLCSLKSMNIPYMSPISPYIKGENKDTILRAPLWQLKLNPRIIGKQYTKIK